MKTNSFSLARATSLGQVPRQLHLIQRRLRWPISRSWFLRVLLLLALPVAVQAQFTFTTNSGTITITKYTGSGGDVTIPSMQTNQFGFNMTWASGMTVVVEAAANFANPAWLPVGTNTLTDGSSYFSDPQWTNYPALFYRLRAL